MGSFFNYQYIFRKTLHEGKYFQWIQEMFLKVKCIPMWQGSTFSQGTEHTIEEFPENSVLNDHYVQSILFLFTH